MKTQIKVKLFFVIVFSLLAFIYGINYLINWSKKEVITPSNIFPIVTELSEVGQNENQEIDQFEDYFIIDPRHNTILIIQCLFEGLIGALCTKLGCRYSSKFNNFFNNGHFLLILVLDFVFFLVCHLLITFLLSFVSCFWLSESCWTIFIRSLNRLSLSQYLFLFLIALPSLLIIFGVLLNKFK